MAKGYAEKALLRYLQEFGGWYECPKDSNGKRLGPLVGYAGAYLVDEAGSTSSSD